VTATDGSAQPRDPDGAEDSSADKAAKPSIRQLVHWATGDREAEAKALAADTPGDVDQQDAEVAVKRAHGDVPKPSTDPQSEVATAADVEAVEAEHSENSDR
jgi:hypothetical protein